LATPAGKGKGRTFLVPDVDLGDGRRSDCWLRLGRHGIMVRRRYGRKVMTLSLREAAEIVARRAQLPIERLLAGGVGGVQ
jgi:hypothetical protein